MIEATDIRIGNMVWYYDYHMVETPFRVEGVLEGYVYNSGLPRSRLPLDKVHPFPLEAAHLLDFGFLAGDPAYGENPALYAYRYNRKDSIYILDAGGQFQPVAKAGETFVPYGRPVIHLHQLQNLFFDLTRDDVFTT
ncbi:hypothetical protein ACWKWU_21225 [Chitinophaga lutea]